MPRIEVMPQGGWQGGNGDRSRRRQDQDRVRAGRPVRPGRPDRRSTEPAAAAATGALGGRAHKHLRAGGRGGTLRASRQPRRTQTANRRASAQNHPLSRHWPLPGESAVPADRCVRMLARPQKVRPHGVASSSASPSVSWRPREGWKDALPASHSSAPKRVRPRSRRRRLRCRGRACRVDPPRGWRCRGCGRRG